MCDQKRIAVDILFFSLEIWFSEVVVCPYVGISEGVLMTGTILLESVLARAETRRVNRTKNLNLVQD